MSREDHIKYPRTPYLPCGFSDDTYLFEISRCDGGQVEVTEKMGGEKTTLYREGRHAWSVDSR